MARPVAFPTIAKGSEIPRSCAPRAVSIYTQPFHPPSEPARESSATIPHPGRPRPVPPNAPFRAAPGARAGLRASPGDGHGLCHDGAILRLAAFYRRAPIWTWIEDL